jgi:hypothetical protein
MIALPPAIAQQFEQFLTRKGLPPTVRFSYRKWLRFYWDFCHKYHHDSFHSDSLPLFLRKLQDKHQSEPQQKQAQHAVSLFYEMQTAPVRRPINLSQQMIPLRALQASLCLINPSTKSTCPVSTMLPGMTLRVELWPIHQKLILLRHKPEPAGSLCSIVC